MVATVKKRVFPIINHRKVLDPFRKLSFTSTSVGKSTVDGVAKIFFGLNSILHVVMPENLH